MAFEFTLSETKTVSCTKGVEWNYNVAVGVAVEVEVPLPLTTKVTGSLEVKINFLRDNSLHERSEFRWQERKSVPNF